MELLRLSVADETPVTIISFNSVFETESEKFFSVHFLKLLEMCILALVQIAVFLQSFASLNYGAQRAPRFTEILSVPSCSLWLRGSLKSCITI